MGLRLALVRVDVDMGCMTLFGTKSPPLDISYLTENTHQLVILSAAEGSPADGLRSLHYGRDDSVLAKQDDSVLASRNDSVLANSDNKT